MHPAGQTHHSIFSEFNLKNLFIHKIAITIPINATPILTKFKKVIEGEIFSFKDINGINSMFDSNGVINSGG